MVLLTQNRQYTLDQLCGKLEISRRNLYYYLDALRDSGFIVQKAGQVYRLDKSSPFFKEVSELINFTDDEAFIIKNLLDSANSNSLQIRHLKEKLDNLYDFHVLDNVQTNNRLSHITSELYEAVKQHKVVKICGYSSPHSNTTSDRIVEPFMFLNGNDDIRCYEIESGANKTFKLSRMDDVQLIDVLWSNEQKHRWMYTDLFQFSSEVTMPVVLRLNRLSYNILKEEYPASGKSIVPEGNESWLFSTDVCSYKGIGRFVLGLSDDIVVVDTEDFKNYLNEKIGSMSF